MLNLELDSNIAWKFQSFIPEMVDSILKEVKPNANVYFESYFEEYSFDDEGESPSCSSGLSIYLSKDDYINKKIFKKIETSTYGSGGIYSHISVYKCGLMNRYNRFLFNEFKEYFDLKNEELLHRMRRSTTMPVEKVRELSRFIGVDFILVPLDLEQEERLYRDLSSREI